MITSNSPIRIPIPVEEKLREVKVARYRARVAHALVLSLLALLLAMCAAMLIDWTFTLFDPFWRTILTLTALGTAGVTLVVSIVIGLSRGGRWEQIAAEVDRTVPQTEERWSTVAELAGAPLEQQRLIHAGLMNRLSQEATKLEPEVSSDDVVSLRGVMATVLGVCALVLLLLVACLIDWQQTSVLVKRFWAPTANISMTRLESPSEDLVVARGEPVTLEATMTGRPVETATLFLQKQDGSDPERIPLEPIGVEEKRFVHHIKTADEALTYRLRAGDGQTEWRSVTVVNRPEIAAVRFRAIPPEYTEQEPIQLNEFPEKVSVVQGTMLEVGLLPTAAIAQVTFRLDDEDVRKLPATEGGWYQFRTKLEEDLRIAAVLTEEHGLENKHPPVCHIHVKPDAAPSVEILAPTEELAARPDDEIEITFAAKDDYGIAKAELVIFGSDSVDGGTQEMQVIDIPLHDKLGETSIAGAVPLSLEKLNVEDGQELKFAVRVYDTRQSTASTETPEMSSAGDRPSPAQSLDEQQLVKNATPSASSLPESQPTESEDKANPGQRTSPSELASNSNNKPDTPSARSDLNTTPNRPSPNIKQPSPSQSPSDTSTPRNSAPTQPASNTPSSESPQPAEPTSSSQTPTELASSTPTTPSPGDASQPQSPSANEGSSDSNQTSTNASAEASNNAQSSPPPSGNNSESQSETSGAPRPPDDMTRRSLDVAQSSTSGVMKLRIDKWAGSFAGQQRRKLEMSIAPRLAELDQLLKVAENRFREGLDELEQDVDWAGPQDRLLHAGDEKLNKALEITADLRKTSLDTPYAFIGLQLGEIAETHIVPAGEAVWNGLQAKSNETRQPLVEHAWQQTGRARQRLAELSTQFERIRREHALADAVEEVKTMYQVFVEDSFALLEQDPGRINNFQRRMAQFELDEEYLKRLEEVLKMRQKLIAEFARILAEDPRLLKRFIDSINNQSETLRDQLTLLTLRQQDLDAQVQGWNSLDDDLRSRALAGIARKTLQDSIDLSRSAAELQEQFETWSPLDLGVSNGAVQSARRQLALVASSARQIEDKAASWRSPQAQSKEPEGADSGEADESASDQQEDELTSLGLSSVTGRGRELYEHLLSLDAQLITLSAENNHPDLGPFLVRRLADTRRLIAKVSAWVHQVELLDEGAYNVAASVEQHQLAQETNELTANLADLERQLVGVLQRQDNTLPEDIANLSRQLFVILDERVAASQLGAVFALKRNTMTAAAARTHDAAEGMVEAEQLFDELIKRAIDEADKLPVQDPIADLLDDPTLDELLALLENEQDLAAALGIPNRPTNLNIIGDFLRSGVGGGGSGMAGMVAAQLSARMRMMQRAQQRAVNRAEAESSQISSNAKRQIDSWNVLASELEERLLQGEGQLPPEEYRRAIEQYFSEITRQASKTDSP